MLRGSVDISTGHVPTRTVFVDNFPSFFILPPPADLNIKRSTINVYSKYSSAVANRPHDASCMSAVSFDSTKRRVESFIVSYMLHIKSLRAVKYAVLLSLA